MEGVDDAEPDLRRHRAIQALKLLVAATVIAFLVITVLSESGRIGDANLRFSPGWLVAGIVPLFLFQAAQGELALAVLRQLGHSLEPVRGRSIFGSALLARYVPSGALVFALRISLNEREGVPKAITTVAMLYEVALALPGAGLMALPLLMVSRDPVVWLAILAPTAGGLVGLHPRLLRRLTTPVLRRFGRDALAVTIAYRSVVLLVLSFAASFVLGGLSLACTLRAITPVGTDDLVQVIASFGLGFITGLLGFALPGGLGAREAGLVAGLSGVLSAPIALAAAAVSRLVQTGVEFAYAGMATLLHRFRRSRRVAITPSK